MKTEPTLFEVLGWLPLLVHDDPEWRKELKDWHSKMMTLKQSFSAIGSMPIPPTKEAREILLTICEIDSAFHRALADGNWPVEKKGFLNWVPFEHAKKWMEMEVVK